MRSAYTSPVMSGESAESAENAESAESAESQPSSIACGHCLLPLFHLPLALFCIYKTHVFHTTSTPKPH